MKDQIQDQKKDETLKSFKKILSLYNHNNLNDIKDFKIKILCSDKKKHLDKVELMRGDLQSVFDNIKLQAQRMEVDVKIAVKVIQHIDNQIVERHNELTKGD